MVRNMKTFKTLTLAAAISAGLLGSAGVMAANDGSPGASSTGEFLIEFEVDGQIVIKGMDNITLPDGANDDGDLIGWDTVCVGTTSSAGSYSVTAATDTGDFKLTNTTGGSGGTAPYTLYYADGINNPGSATLDNTNELTHGVAKTGLTGLASDGLTCTAAMTSTVWVKLAKSDIPTVNGTYQDTVFLTVAPE